MSPLNSAKQSKTSHDATQNSSGGAGAVAPILSSPAVGLAVQASVTNNDDAFEAQNEIVNIPSNTKDLLVDSQVPDSVSQDQNAEHKSGLDTNIKSSIRGDSGTVSSKMSDKGKEETTGPPPEDKNIKLELDTESKEPDREVDPEKEAYKQDEQDAALQEVQIVEKQSLPPGEEEDDTKSEIQSIMEQFEDGMGGPGAEEIMSPRLERAGPMLGSPTLQHPPRKSSLEPLRSGSQTSLLAESSPPPTGQGLPPRSSSLVPSSHSGLGIDPAILSKELPDSPSSPLSARKHAALPPHPDPEPDLPFDFHRFLEQLRHRSADPVAKFLRSFLQEFAKKQWMVHEQVKIVSDFLDFIAKKMAQCDVWRTVSDAEFDNACEGMEKLVMNRLYSQTFSPAIPAPRSERGKRRILTGPGRRGQHQEDVERDEVLAQKVRIYSWVKPQHLDIKEVNDKGQKFLSLAQQELLKIGNYRAPRDKVICVLNCCKVIFGFLKNSHHDQSADSFVPLLIFTVLRANPPNLVSNVQYILRFRNANKLTGEAGYYVSSLGGAIEFIERLDRTSLTITDDDFEKNVEAAVSAIAERHPDPSTTKPLPIPKAESEIPPPLPQRTRSLKNGNKSDSESEESAAVAGLLRTIQRPLSTIGRIFSDEGPATPSRAPEQPQPQLHPQPPTTPQPPLQPPQLSAEDAAARQASKEAEEARRIRQREESHVVETLSGMFPALDREVVIDVVRANEGRIGSAVDACLALST